MKDFVQKNSGWVIIILIGVIIWGVNARNQLIEENDLLISEADHLQTRLSNYEDALSQANDNISEANSAIEEAQGYAWSSYEEMGGALENLQTVDEVSTP